MLGWGLINSILPPWAMNLEEVRQRLRNSWEVIRDSAVTVLRIAGGTLTRWFLLVNLAEILKDIFIDWFIWLCWVLVSACGILVPWSGMESGLLALGAQGLSHWTTTEIPWLTFLVSDFHFSDPPDILARLPSCTISKVLVGGRYIQGTVRIVPPLALWNGLPKILPIKPFLLSDPELVCLLLASKTFVHALVHSL